MKRSFLSRLLYPTVVLTMMVAASPSAIAFESPSLPGFADVADQLKESVVTIATAVVDRSHPTKPRTSKKKENDDDSDSSDDFVEGLPKPKPGEPARQFTSMGSGFIIDPAGLIVTNNHVIEGGNEIFVIFHDGTSAKVDKVLGRDKKTDISLLKITPKKGQKLSAVSFGRSSKVRVGDWVLAVGNPFGLGGTVTAGIISGKGRDINAGPYDEFLQTDAPINRGNSGGPLFNANGEVIGINTAIFSPSGGSIGLGFAIPSDMAQRVVHELQEYGATRWGTIGVRVQTVSDDLAKSLGLEKPTGALVARLDRGGPAEAAGIKEGDVIMRFGESPVKYARQLHRFVALRSVGEEVTLDVLRAGAHENISVKVGLLNEKPDTVRAPALSIPRQRRQRT